MFEKNPIYIYTRPGKKCEESGFLLLCIKFAIKKKKKNIKAFISLQARNFLAQITRVSSSDKVSPLDGWNLSRNSVSPDLTERP